MSYLYNGDKTQLTSVVDAKSGLRGFPGGTTAYAYGGRCNVVSASGRGAYTIEYNDLNLPYKIQGKGQDEIWYTYSREKLRMCSPDGRQVFDAIKKSSDTKSLDKERTGQPSARTSSAFLIVDLSDQGIGRFMRACLGIACDNEMDPIADQYPHVTVYNYAENEPVLGNDLWGLQYADANTGKSKGPINPLNSNTTVSEEYDVNNNGVQDHYLPEVTVKAEKITTSGNGSNSQNVALNTSGNSAVSSGIDLTIPSTISDGIGGLGGGLQTQGGSMRITNGATNGNALSLKYYESGWQGGSRARITTYQLGTAGKLVGKAGTAGTLIVGGVDIISNARSEGGFGTNTQQAVGRTAGSLLGGYGGAAAGAAIGSLFGGVGAIPGGIIGGLYGGYRGSKAGEGAVKYLQERP